MIPSTEPKIHANGVYQPINHWAGLIEIIGLSSFAAYQLYIGRIAPHVALIFLILSAAPTVFRKIRYGSNGIPLMEISSSELKIYLPGDSRKHISFPIEKINKIEVYGRTGKRKYRVKLVDESFIDVAPLFFRKAEKSVALFMTTMLPQHITVKVHEPQTMFAEVRGDGPPSD